MDRRQQPAALIVFAREPLAGRTKTRLTPPLSAADAAALYACFLRDTLDTARRVAGAAVVVAYTPAQAGGYFADLAPELVAVPQRGADLGERMDTAFSDAFARGAAAAVIIGSDSPHLPATIIERAFAELESGADLVLGPADDGGYYLIGARAPQPRLLRAVPLSTPTVLADTLRVAAELGLRVALLPRWYDIDTVAELRRLAAELAHGPPDVAPQTRAFLAGMELPA
jgi:uncharacterized protein